MKICVIGAGRWGKNHVRTLNELGWLGGIVDCQPDRLAQFQSEYPHIQTFESLDAPGALNFEAYTVAAPAEYHYDIAKTLLNAGKHVLVEKPITLTSGHARELHALADRKGLTLMVGHLLLFHPAIRKIKHLIESGKIGKLQYIYSNRLNLGTVRTEENSLWNFAPHDISIFQYFIGDLPVNVSCRGGAFLQPHIHDTTMTVLTYPNNIVGHIFVSWLHPFKEHRIVVMGSKGMLSFDDSSPEKEVLFYEKGIDFINGEPIKRDGPTEVVAYEKGQALTNEMIHFVDGIAGKDTNTIIGGNKGMEVLEILEQAEAQLQAPDLPQGTELPAARPELISEDAFIHPKAVVDQNVRIGARSKVWHFSHIQPNSTIGTHCILGQNVNIASNVTIGNYCKIQNNVSVYEGVELEDYVFCGPSMVFTNIKAPRCKYPQADSQFYIKTRVRQGASIGANATVVCGVTIGQHAFIGAGAVITKDVPDYALVIGNPGRVVGWVSEAGLPLNFNDSNEAFCSKSGKAYRLTNDTVVELEAVEATA